MKKILILMIFVFLTACGIETENQLNQYNIVWDSPSRDHHGSMPIGNGSCGLNVWVEENGDLCFYIGRTDSWGDNGRLLKVGKVRITCDPPLVSFATEFKQELDLETGTIRITAKGISGGNNNKLNHR